jgi:peptide deformylase
MSIKKCPCFSGESYDKCCKTLHLGKKAENARQLMRSRYSAYALCMPDYIINTTHPASPEYHEDRAKWKRAISSFSQSTKFEGLDLVDFQENGNTAMVIFVAKITQKKRDESFTEKSFFEKIHGRWYYRTGQLLKGHAPNLMTIGQLKLLPLAYYGNPILRKVADRVPEITDSVRKLIEDMIETMDACDGIGLAAPQVHHSVQIFVTRAPVENKRGLGDVKVFINPKVTEQSEETWTVSEGCLSIPAIHADVTRPSEITIEYTNLEGEHQRERCTGWEARVIQHENDHLNGILFIDYLSDGQKKELEPILSRMDKRIHDGTEL